MAESPNTNGLYIALLSLHGLIRAQEPELGRDADTGGQVTYVLELARALARDRNVWRVDLFTRLIADPKVSEDYQQPEQEICEGAYIIRIPFGPRRYLRKEVLWPWIDDFVDSVPPHFHKLGRGPDIVHGHYADAGLAGSKLAAILGVPFVFTGHSLGNEKRRRLQESGQKAETIENRYNISTRIEAEEQALGSAALVVASTNQEIEKQYSLYRNYQRRRVQVIPPGVDISRFRPPKRGDKHAAITAEVNRFLRDPRRPWVLALARADERKNLRTLVESYGESSALQKRANLVIFAGSREDIREMDAGAKQVLTEMLMLVDFYDLHGRAAYPKKHTLDDVPEIYREAARGGGVFVNPALTEPFGLTLIEAAASGLPVVATNDGGPQDIIARCKNGFLIDPLDKRGMSASLLGILENRKRWRRWAASGVRAVNRHYTWSSHAQNYLRAVRKALKHPPGRRVSESRSRLPTVDRMLLCDIDNTLIGDREGLEALLKKIEPARDKMALGIATGRRRAAVLSILEEWNVPRLDLFFTSVGTEIYYGPSMTQDTGWYQYIDYHWHPQKIRKVLADIPGLREQPKSEQRPHKVSYYIDPSKSPSIREIQRILRSERLQVQLFFSHGQFLDVLPVRASKGLAIRYIAYKWGLPIERVLVAGGSGNDVEMLGGKTLGVVVGNHSEELESLRGKERIYFAEGHHAWGIMEGIDHYLFLEEIRQPQEQLGVSA